MNVQQDIYQLIVQRYLMGREVEGLNMDTHLTETGILDSFMLVGMLSYLEKKYDFIFGCYEIVPENFSSIARLAEVIEQKIAEAV